MKSSFIPWLFGVFIGWSCGAAYVALHEDTLFRKLEEERAVRLKAQFDEDATAARERRAQLELDALRRRLMRDRADWWLLPPDDDCDERIPPTKLPTR